jgi:acetyl-CoA carboxylase biotin carboxylase subunit
MRVAMDKKELERIFPIAASEALACFNDGDLYLEKFFTNPRHIEMQLMGDIHGNTIFLGERDCTVQRRHQKLIEESPSPAITPKLRKKIGEIAVRGARSVKYHNAGTMEFLFDNGNFYFMEMNTRIQVEHPVTEMVTGVDLIRQQILVAAGEKLDFAQKDIQLQGHSIECRINAEDPFDNFKPSPGTIGDFNMPGGIGVRVDTHCYNGYVVPPYYDSMLAKLIVHAPTREKAIMRMLRALDEFVIEGVKTTIPVQKNILRHPDFISGNFDTKFLEIYPELLTCEYV